MDSEPLLQPNRNQEKPGQMSTKKCACCGEVKPLSEFHRYRYDPSGRQPHCKMCRTDKNGKGYSQSSATLQQELGLTRQPLGTPCDVFGTTDKLLVFDHDHDTNKFRGWITAKANTGIGTLGDDIDGVTKALLYLLRVTNLTDTDKEVLSELQNKLNEIIN